MKKIIFCICALVLLMTGVAHAECTGEDFQKEVNEMRSLMTALSQDSTKMAQANQEMGALYAKDLEEFTALVQAVAAEPARQQEMLDAGCALYKKMNATLKKHQ